MTAAVLTLAWAAIATGVAVALGRAIRAGDQQLADTGDDWDATWLSAWPTELTPAEIDRRIAELENTL